jgi:3-deoxy-manno-octulosonate cytidylyltransferase (CMP-KDO synthetase)
VDEFLDPNVVKVVTDREGYALYFSRAGIPYHRQGLDDGVTAWHHIGLYVYRKDFLLRYASLAPSPLEGLERLEQLRVLENGYRIKVVIDDHAPIGVDTEEDLMRVRQIFTKETR